MKKLNLIAYASSLAPRESLFTDHHEMLAAIESHYDVNYVFPEQLREQGLPTDGATMVLVGSGGVEELVKNDIDLLPPYVVLLADGLKNSLAASLEILSWMRMNGRHGRVLHELSLTELLAKMDRYEVAIAAVTRLRGKRVGVIGKPSGWLIASNVSGSTVKDHWGVEMLDLPLDEVVSRYEAVPDEAVQQLTDDFIAAAVEVKEPSRDEVVKAMRLYQAVSDMCEHYQLDAFTLNCFDLIPTTRTTGCVALALLNQRGIPAGCEGDEQTLLTMLAVQTATGEPTFMANPSSRYPKGDNELVLAHCTIAPNFVDRYVVRDHYESRSGVGIQGEISAGSPVTIVKCGGRNMERCFVSPGTVNECTDNPNMCRTQFVVTIGNSATLEYFMERSIGNHHVIVRGDHAEGLSTMFKMLGATIDEGRG